MKLFFNGVAELMWNPGVVVFGSTVGIALALNVVPVYQLMGLAFVYAIVYAICLLAGSGAEEKDKVTQ